MGVKTSKQKDLLDGSAWLRTVVQHYQKRRQGVAGFDSFTIEPVFSPASSHVDNDVVDNADSSCVDEVRLFRVDITFRNNKGTTQEVYWIVKAAALSTSHFVDNVNVSTKDDALRSVERLSHEIKVYTCLMSDIAKFLESRKNPRSRFLLNIPSLVFHERTQRSGRVVRCHLVTEDVSRTKRCWPMGRRRAERGMSLAQFKVFLGTVAQFHAVGVCWNNAKRDDSALDLFPFLHRKPLSSCETKVRRDVYLSMFEKLLLWHFGLKNQDRREVQLFNELKRNAEKILATNLRQDMCDPLGGVCLGNLLPSEVQFQYEASFASLFDLCRNGFDGKKWQRCDDGDDGREEQRTPVCAAVATCHRVFFGHLLRELATLFYIMPEPLVRQRYLVLMLQSYCHVITITMEMLEVDWFRHFKMSFHQVVTSFFEQIPQAILRSIIAHMKLTDPMELDRLVTTNHDDFINGDIDDGCIMANNNDNDTINDNLKESPNTTPLQRRKTIPLTRDRVQFLVRLLDPVTKPV